VYSEKTPDDGQENCPKYVEFYPKNKFEKLVHLGGFIIRKFVFKFMVKVNCFESSCLPVIIRQA